MTTAAVRWAAAENDGCGVVFEVDTLLGTALVHLRELDARWTAVFVGARSDDELGVHPGDRLVASATIEHGDPIAVEVMGAPHACRVAVGALDRLIDEGFRDPNMQQIATHMRAALNTGRFRAVPRAQG